MKKSHKNSYQGHLDHAQWTNATDHALGTLDAACPEDCAAALIYASRPATFVPPPGPFPPGSWMPQPPAWVS
jgi:hypothetical protein